ATVMPTDSSYLRRCRVPPGWFGADYFAPPAEGSALSRSVPGRPAASHAYGSLPFRARRTARRLRINGCHRGVRRMPPRRTLRPVYLDRLPPCNRACPAGEHVQAWLAEAQAGRYRAAWVLILRDNPFPGVHGRACFTPGE